jgi:hypothetical protein
MGMAAAAATVTSCDFLLRILATCEKDGVFIFGTDRNLVSPPLSGAGLTLFFLREPKLSSQSHIESHGL